ncbi:MAG: hypothetical protein IT318_01260 [Anaerolineales bacterium]|nr:hypothetical protein [Anaerolineales bacterium]
MPESVDKTIREAVQRFSGSISKPLNVKHPYGLDEAVGSTMAAGINSEVVQIGFDKEFVVLLDPLTSEVISKRLKADAYMQFVGALKADHQTQRQYYIETLSAARQRAKFSLIAASVGFVIVLIGIVAMMFGFAAAGLVTSASGILSEVVALLFFREARQATDRLDRSLERLLESEGFFRAFVIADQIPEAETRNRVIEAIVMRIIGPTVPRSGGQTLER